VVDGEDLSNYDTAGDVQQQTQNDSETLDQLQRELTSDSLPGLFVWTLFFTLDPEITRYLMKTWHLTFVHAFAKLGSLFFYWHSPWEICNKNVTLKIRPHLTRIARLCVKYECCKLACFVFTVKSRENWRSRTMISWLEVDDIWIVGVIMVDLWE